MLEFCAAHGVPVNDTWAIWGADAAAAATAALQAAATAAPTTAAAVAALDDLLRGFPSSCVRIAGTYPHDQWQGSRIEGFVIAQGEPVSDAAVTRLQRVAEEVQHRQLPLQPFLPGAPLATVSPSVNPTPQLFR